MAHICIVNGIGDTVARFRGALIASLVRSGHTVVLSTPHGVEVADAAIAAEITALGAQCVFSPLDRTSLNPLKDRAAITHWRALFRTHRFDAVLITNPKPVFHATRAARAEGVPRIVAMITGLGYAFTAKGLKPRVLRVLAGWMYARALRAADCVLFQNQDDRCVLTGFGADLPDAKCGAIGGSGVDLDRFVSVPLPTAPPVILMVARLLGDKGVREFAHAARIVRRTRPDVRFRLVGWIDANPSAISRAELDGWINEGVIEYAGRLDDVRDELARCTIFALPSYREGTPMSVLEALATARPIVTTDAPGCRETIRSAPNSNGVLVAVRDAQALANGILSLLAKPHDVLEKMGLQSRQLAERRFDVRLVNATIERALLGGIVDASDANRA